MKRFAFVWCLIAAFSLQAKTRHGARNVVRRRRRSAVIVRVVLKVAAIDKQYQHKEQRKRIGQHLSYLKRQ